MPTRGAALRAAVLVACAAACTAGCGEQDLCDQAVDKLVSECELGGGAGIDSNIVECSGLTKCRAKCVNKNSCKKIGATEPGPYAQCLADCEATP